MVRAYIIAVVLLFSSKEMKGQSNGQFIFTLMDGQRFTRTLDPAWRPVFEGNFLYITPRDRLFTIDLAAVQPAWPDDMRNKRSVRLLFRNHLGRGSQLFWIPDAYPSLSDAPHKDGFLVIDEQTLIREGIYRMVVE